MTRRKVYDWDSMRWVTVQVLYAGRGSMPHEIVNAVYWRQKASLTDYAPGREHFPAEKEMRKAVKAPSWRQQRDESKVKPPASAATHCGCGRALYPSEIGKGIRRCVKCRSARAAGRNLTRKVA
jgi:hypothetical protein